MSEQEAYALIEEKLRIAKEAIAEAVKIAKDEDLEFTIEIGDLEATFDGYSWSSNGWNSSNC